MPEPDPRPRTLAVPHALEREQRRWLISRFATLDKALSDGAGFSNRTNDSGALAWAESPLLEAYLDMYLATGNHDHLDRFVAHANRIITNTDHHRNVVDSEGRSLVAWSATRYGEGERRAYSVHSALIVTPLLRFVNIVKSTPDLQKDYGSWAGRFQKVSEEALSLFEDEFHIDPVTGEGFIVPFHHSEGGEASRFAHAPLNIDAAMGRAYLYLAEATGDTAFRQRARALARHVHSSLMTRDGRFIWSYYCWRRRASNPRMEDASHGSLTVAFAVDAFREGLVFDSIDMVAFGRTLEAMSRAGDGFSYFVSGEVREIEDEVVAQSEERLYSDGDAIARWLMLLPHAPFVQDSAASYLKRRLSGSERVHPLALLGTSKLLRHTVADRSVSPE
jgi:hypothetical protein